MRRLEGLWATFRVVLVLALAAAGPLCAQRTLGPSAADERFGSEAERRDWEEVVQAPESERTRKAMEFLARRPESAKAADAHYFVADEAFRAGRFPTFRDHAEAALAGSRDALTGDSSEKARWLQLMAQLAFFYAESGADQAAEEKAARLLELLETPRPANLTATQWSEHRLRLSASARYALGRVWLSRASGSDDSERVAQALARAVENFKLALSDNPSDDYACYRLAAAYAMQGRRDLAAEFFARAAAAGGVAAQPARKRLEALVGSSPVEEWVSRERAELAKQLLQRPRSVLALPGGAPHPVFWWDGVPEEVRRGSLAPGPFSNIRRADYAGPETCRPCHQDKFDGWSKHAHKRMNAWADAENVVGDFSKGASIQYRGGLASFETRDGAYWMRLTRGWSKRLYRVERTIGSRFFQYYVGRLVEGPEPDGHPVRSIDHVLPFGFWIDRREWVPIVHIDQETPDQGRDDPFAAPSDIAYDRSCSACHTTRPLGDWMLRTDGRLRLAQFSPRELSFFMSAYLAENHPELVPPGRRPADFGLAEVREILDQKINALPAREYAVTLGVSCEACHNGAKVHAEKSRERETDQRPLFFPSGPQVLIQTDEDPAQVWARNPRNVNWICARCHSGSRPRFAAGMDTWNSTEFSDASRGFCYKGDPARGLPPLTCVTCHDPHFTIGKKWSRPPEQDDAKCLGCHVGLQEDEPRSRHTRHAAGSEGSRCLNCHMPRLNEGMQDVVRTHRIFNPTNPGMIEANQPNACNLCHLDQSIDWTLARLKDWYGKTYSESKIAANYPNRQGPAALGWLASPHEPTRLVAIDTLTRADARWAIAQLIETLDDPYLLNRQFAQQGLERMLGVALKDYGYRFYQFESERRRPLEKIRAAFGRSGESD